MTDLKLRSEVKNAWVDALRSGEYQQGKGKLRDHENRYCCLGVLADLAIKSGEIDGLEWHETSRDGLIDPDGLFWAGVLSPSVTRWAFQALDATEQTVARDPLVEVSMKGLTKRAHLSMLNDGVTPYGWPVRSFEEIADIIVEQL